VCPLASFAQQPKKPVVGFLTSLGRTDRPELADAFRRGLSEAGFVEGRNVALEYRFAEINTIDCRRSQPTWSAARSR